MRASGVRTAIVTAVLAATVDGTTGRDVFRHLDTGGREPASVSERSFVVELDAIEPATTYGQRIQVAVWTLRVFYTASPVVEDRIAEDAERIIEAVHPLHASTADISAVDVSTLRVAPGPADGTLEGRVTLRVTYSFTTS